MTERSTLETAMERVLKAWLAGVYVARPARVESYDAATQTVSVKSALKPVVNTADGRSVREPALLEKVPVAFPRGGGYFVSFPIAAGDYVLLVCADQSIDLWASKGGIVDPIDVRQHAYADAIAIPGVFPSPDALSDAHASNMVMGKDGGSQIHIKDNGEVHVGGENADDFVAKATETNSNFDSVVTELNKIQVTLASLTGSASFTTPYTNAFTSATDVETSVLKAD